MNVYDFDETIYYHNLEKKQYMNEITGSFVNYMRVMPSILKL